LKLRYGIPVTAELVVKDNQGWYPKLLIHYFLTIGREHLAQRDAAIARQLIEQGNGSIFLPDFNRSQLGAAVGTMEILGIPVLLQDEGRELKNTDEDLKAMAALALANRASIKTALGIGLPANATPITIIRRLLDKIDYGLKCVRRESASQKRVRVYQVVTPSDGRFEVFKHWLASEVPLLSPQTSWLDEHSSEVNSQVNCMNLDESEYVQLSLSF
jgi:hypothetical protein